MKKVQLGIREISTGLSNPTPAATYQAGLISCQFQSGIFPTLSIKDQKDERPSSQMHVLRMLQAWLSIQERQRATSAHRLAGWLAFLVPWPRVPGGMLQVHVHFSPLTSLGNLGFD